MKKIAVGVACLMIAASATHAFSRAALVGNTSGLTGTVVGAPILITGVELPAN